MGLNASQHHRIGGADPN